LVAPCSAGACPGLPWVSRAPGRPAQSGVLGPGRPGRLLASGTPAVQPLGHWEGRAVGSWAGRRPNASEFFVWPGQPASAGGRLKPTAPAVGKTGQTCSSPGRGVRDVAALRSFAPAGAREAFASGPIAHAMGCNLPPLPGLEPKTQ